MEGDSGPVNRLASYANGATAVVSLLAHTEEIAIAPEAMFIYEINILPDGPELTRKAEKSHTFSVHPLNVSHDHAV